MFEEGFSMMNRATLIASLTTMMMLSAGLAAAEVTYTATTSVASGNPINGLVIGDGHGEHDVSFRSLDCGRFRRRLQRVRPGDREWHRGYRPVHRESWSRTHAASTGAAETTGENQRCQARLTQVALR